MSIVDECRLQQEREREAIDQSYILLTNSKKVDEDSRAILKVSSAHQMSQFEKALSKVGITNYHHLTVEELRDNENIIDVLR